jgi:3-oxoacyl-(acyl-carrier-protein) synthase
MKIPVTALKPFVGHNLGGSTLIELAVLLLNLKQKRILPIMNTSHPNEKLGLDLVLKERVKDVKLFMKICCAFAGYNAASIFKVVNEK